jgi:Sugar-transfer associated ATP-grasp
MSRNLFQTVRNYLAVSMNIAKYEKRNFLLILPRIIAGRVFYGMGPDKFDRRRFSGKKLRQNGEYLTLRERENLQKSLCPEDAREQVESKLRFHEKCLSRGIPTPRIYGAILTDECYVPKDIPVARTRQELRDLLVRLPAGMYIVKPINAGHGWGVAAYHVENGRLSRFSGEVVDPDRFLRQITENRYNSTGYLFQEYVRPHGKLQPIMPGPGLGTFRIVTFLMGGRTVEIPFAVVKIPVGGSVTDNFDGGYSGNWVCPVDVGTGRLGNAVGKSASVPVFAEIERRPDTGARFREVIVPRWGDVRSTVINAALVFSDLRTIGWDVAVTDKGVTILEANWDWGENLIEVAHNRGLRVELTELTKRSLSAAGK